MKFLIHSFLFILTAMYIPSVAQAQLSWREYGKLKQGRHLHTAAYIGNSKILVIGGRVNSNGAQTGAPTTSCEIINYGDSTITLTSSMNVARAEFVSLVMPDSNIIAISGITGNGNTGALTPTCEVYDRTTGQWKITGNLLVERRQHVATFINDTEILVVGGRQQNLTTLADAEIFNIKTGKSKKIKNFPFPINFGFIHVASNGDILAGAGRSGGPDSYREKNIYRYNILSDSWAIATQTTEAVHEPSVLKLYSRNLLFTGGSLTEYIWNFSHQVLLEDDGIFKPLSNLTKNRTWHVSEQWNSDSAMVMGGFNSTENTVLSDCEWINTSTGKTSIGPSLLVGRSATTAIAIPSSIPNQSAALFVIAGVTSSGANEASVEILERSIPPIPCTKISGIINSYGAVTQISNSKLFVTVSDAAGFKKDDQVLFIQMQGAEIDTTNTSAYGMIKDIRGAGDYEFAVIEGVSGNTVTFTKPLSGVKYDVSGKIQLVTVPEYSKAIVRDSLSCAPWNGTTGGILALSANCITLEGKIDVSGRGFRGGEYRVDPCNPEISSDIYVTSDRCFASKGEGIAGYGIENRTLGRGAPVNGGGGGNSHNGGGGGGSNSAKGGNGGFGYIIKPNSQLAGGIGGSPVGIENYSNKVFMGGGGGAGQINDGHGSAGGNGGGIVIIRANIIENEGNFPISTNGADAFNDFAPVNPDGCGGGGAGGSIVIDDTEFTSSLPLSANGGNGGSRLRSAIGHGTGGGGSGGFIRYANASNHQAYVMHTYTGGKAGTALEGGTYGAADGQSGMTHLSSNSFANPIIPGEKKLLEKAECKTCYPTIETAQQLCSPATFIAKDDIYPLQSIELDNTQSENVTMQLSGSLPSNAITGTLTLIDPTKPGKFLLRGVNEDDNSVTYAGQVYPAPSPSVNSSGENLSAINTQPNDVLQWYYNGAAITGATGKNYKAANSGEYHLEVTNIYGCKGTSAKVLVTISGINDNVVTDEFFALYPNPAVEQLYIESKHIINEQLTIEITNLLGESAFKTDFQPTGNSFKTSVPLENLPSGTYYIHISSGTFKKVYKIVRN